MNYPKPAHARPAPEGPLLRHLREIAEGSRTLPSTPARRHHFVPSFSLARFAKPQKRDGTLFQLDVASGRPSRTTPDKSAFVEELYSFDTDDGPDRSLEAFLAVVENYAAPAIAKLLERPLDLTSKDRQTIAYYLAFQYLRTPVVIEHTMATSQVTMEMILGAEFSDRCAFRKNYRDKFDPSATDEEIDALHEKTISELENGEVGFPEPKTHALQLLLGGTDRVAEAMYNLEWTLLRSQGESFVTSDRAIAMHDPTPKFVWSGHALESSPGAETTFPLDPEFTLLLRRGRTQIAVADVESRAVCELNLRTYGWATTRIFGESQVVLQRVRQQAKRHRDLVIRPRTPKPVLVETADPDDPKVGAENAARGWPRGIGVGSYDGSQKFAAYTVIDPEKGAGAAAVLGDAAARRVSRRKRD